jgi:hypothetical protein
MVVLMDWDVRNDAAGIGILEDPASDIFRSAIATSHIAINTSTTLIELSKHLLHAHIWQEESLICEAENNVCVRLDNGEG